MNVIIVTQLEASGMGGITALAPLTCLRFLGLHETEENIQLKITEKQQTNGEKN